MDGCAFRRNCSSSSALHLAAIVIRDAANGSVQKRESKRCPHRALSGTRGAVAPSSLASSSLPVRPHTCRRRPQRVTPTTPSGGRQCAAATNNRVEVRVATPVFHVRRRWPGIGLLLMRLVVGAVVLWHVGPRLWSDRAVAHDRRLRVAGTCGDSFSSRGYGRQSLERWSPLSRSPRSSRPANLPLGAFSQQPSPARWRCSDPAACRSTPGSSDGSASTHQRARSSSRG